MCSLRGQVINMAMHKSASIVCEKALTHGSVPSVRALIAEMIFPSMSTSAESPLATMMKDEYARKPRPIWISGRIDINSDDIGS